MQTVEDFECTWHTVGPQEVEAAILLSLRRGSECTGGAVRTAMDVVREIFTGRGGSLGWGQ